MPPASNAATETAASGRPSLSQLEHRSEFVRRHIGPSQVEVDAMLGSLDLKTLSQLCDRAIPDSIRRRSELKIPTSRPEQEVLAAARSYADQNRVFRSLMGMGYAGTLTPTVILRNVLENPGWYTAYTPYQAEISQGRMEALLNFQTVVTDLTGLEIANASLLDEGTAAAEAMALCKATNKKNKSNRFFVSDRLHPQTIEVLQTRAEPMGIELVIDDPEAMPADDYFGFITGYPDTYGAVEDPRPLIEKAHGVGAMAVVVSDLLALTLLEAPGEMGADVVVGNSQRFGVPFGFGGPHAAFFATKEAHKRSVPGRIIGVSKDAAGEPALRLALQTREQHIRREKATSNICTAQVLLAVMAGSYAVYHGPKGLQRIAERVHRFAGLLTRGLGELGLSLRSREGSEPAYFDTLAVEVGAGKADEVLSRGRELHINLRRLDDSGVGVALDEVTTRSEINTLLRVFGGKEVEFPIDQWDAEIETSVPAHLRRSTPYLEHPVFHQHRSETDMLRYLHRLQAKDLSLTHSMIALGSCTMKLNSTTEMIPVTWPEFGQIHPFAPLDQAKGYLGMIRELEYMLSDITGFAGVSLQPNAGSQGEYTGLLVIRRYHESRGEGHRNVCLIPSSAHGTNPASAKMVGMKVVVTKCDDDGNVDIEDLREKATLHADHLAALMVTYPSTHGVFEAGIIEICEVIHEHGGQVYMDGANMNALVGLCRPGEFGPDVAHLNLHKTFCIPHGGGGPGVGPIGVMEHLSPFLPTHSLVPEAGPKTGVSAVASAPWGSASILPISWAYIAMMGRDGLERATQVAILNANYMAKRLEGHYPVLYTGKNGMVAHECIVDTRPFKSAGVEVEDIAKRLMDYGFHAPTMSWPVAGTLMIEPTESESKEELDRFCDAMIQIRKEIAAIESGELDAEDNPLKNAPHTAADVIGEWPHPYDRETAVYPLPWVKQMKFWPSVKRVDNAYGDRNLVCECPPIESYED